MTKNIRLVFLQSLRRCKEKEDFVDCFYDRFLATSEDVRQKFNGTNFTVQKIKLLKSLEILVMAVEGVPEALEQLNQRAVIHNRKNMNIKPEYYDFWMESLLHTVVQCDEQYDVEIERAWREVCSFAIQKMTSKY